MELINENSDLDEKSLEPNIRYDSVDNGGAVVSQRLHMGPLPSASEFAQYEQACPGAGDRIITMAEKEANARHSANNKALDASISDNKRGMYMAFILAGLILTFGFILILFNHYIVGSIFSVSGLGVVLKAFVKPDKESDKNDIE